MGTGAPLAAVSDPRRLASLDRARVLDTPPEESFDRFTRLASKLLEVPIALVSFVDDSREFFKSAAGMGDPTRAERTRPLSHSYCQYIVGSGEPLVVNDAREHPLLQDNPAIEDHNAISYCGVPLTDIEGRVLGSFCVIDTVPRTWSREQVATLQDLSGAVIAELRLRLTAADLEDANAALQEVIAVASHDIRNPLAAILACTYLLGDDPAQLTRDEFRESVAAIKGEAQRANRLVGDLLEVTKIEAGVVETIPQALCLAAVVESTAVADGFIASVPDDVRVWADADHLHRILSNLISNAAKYGAPPITVSGRTDGAGVEIVVSDRGDGVSEDFVGRLFDKFTRSDRARMSGVEGSGLGLSIVARLVEVNGGSVRYEPNEPHGARFIIVLPAVAEVAA